MLNSNCAIRYWLNGSQRRIFGEAVGIRTRCWWDSIRYWRRRERPNCDSKESIRREDVQEVTGYNPSTRCWFSISESHSSQCKIIFNWLESHWSPSSSTVESWNKLYFRKSFSPDLNILRAFLTAATLRFVFRQIVYSLIIYCRAKVGIWWLIVLKQ